MINAVQCNELQQKTTPQKELDKIPSFTEPEDSIYFVSIVL